MCFSVRERESLTDTAKVLYCKKLLGENNALMVTTETAAKSSLPSPHNVLDEGWALRSTKTSKPFSEKQRRFLEEKFTIGETTGRKLDPVTVARQMRVARGSDGQRQFTPEELLSASQIQGFFPAEQNLRIKQWLKLKMISWQLKLKMPWQACEVRLCYARGCNDGLPTPGVSW